MILKDLLDKIPEDCFLAVYCENALVFSNYKNKYLEEYYNFEVLEISYLSDSLRIIVDENS